MDKWKKIQFPILEKEVDKFLDVNKIHDTSGSFKTTDLEMI